MSSFELLVGFGAAALAAAMNCILEVGRGNAMERRNGLKISAAILNMKNKSKYPQ